MRCRCGHGRWQHLRRYGVKRHPCWAVTDRKRWVPGDGKRSGSICRCRDFVEAKP